MSLAAALLASLVVAVASEKSYVTTLPGNILATETKNYKYFSTEAAEAARLLLTYKVDAKAALKRHVKELKTSNAASQALREYNEKLESLRGTKCVDEDEEDQFSGAQENIDTIVDTCAASASQEEVEKLNKVINEALVKIQTADIELMKNAEVCSSLKTNPPVSCEDNRKKALKTLKSTVSPASIARFSFFSKNAFFNNKEGINACVEDGTSDLKDNLDEQNKKLDDCKEHLN